MMFISDFFRERKWARQRAKRGYADIDVWNMDNWFLKTVVPMLEELKETKHGYPSNLREEEWDRIIARMIFCFRQADEDTCTEINEYDLEYNNQLWGNESSKTLDDYLEPIEDNERLYKFKVNEVDPQLQKKWIDRQDEIEKYRNDMKDEAFNLFREHFWSLWD